MDTYNVQCVGVTRCCRQKMLEKLYKRELPFNKDIQIRIFPADYKGYPTYQVYANRIDLGFIPQDKLFIFRKVVIISTTIQVIPRTAPSGRIHYDCILVLMCK